MATSPLLKNSSLFAALLISAAAIAASAEEYVQPPASYEEAVRGSFVSVTSSPAYVKILVVNAETGEERVTCTTANFLAGAIQRQYQLGAGDDDRRRAQEIAIANAAHRFIFNEPALKNVQVNYSPQDLAEVRASLSSLSSEELRAEFKAMSKGKLRLAFAAERYRDAVACVLIEHGLAPYHADITGQVNVK